MTLTVGLLITLVVLGVLLLIALGLLWQRRKSTPKPENNSAKKNALIQAFTASISILEANLFTRRQRYTLPWVMLLGEPESGKTTLVEQAGLVSPLQTDAPQDNSGCNWWYFNRGVMLDCAGQFMSTPQGAVGSDSLWRNLLRLLFRYRPQRPLDAAILSISCEGLLDTTDLGIAERSKRADQIYQRLWELQTQLGVNVPIYVVLTKTDCIPGFSAFASALPPVLQQQMFGWSNPYGLEHAYRSGWTGEAFQTIGDHILSVRADLYALGVPGQEDQLFILPNRLNALASPLTEYLDAIFRQSAYHDTFDLRGIYLTGDANTAPPLLVDSIAETSAPEFPGLDDAPALNDTVQPAPSSRHLVFLRDLFEQKVFAEFGLALPARRSWQVRTRAVVSIRYLMLAITLIWGIGLGIGYYQSSRDADLLKPTLRAIADNRLEMQAGKQRGEWYKKATVGLLEKLSNIDRWKLDSFFMPSSQPLFSDIDQQLDQSLEYALQEVVYRAMRIKLVQRAETIPAKHDMQGAPTSRPLSIAPEQQPEFSRLQLYLEDVANYEHHVALYNALQQDGKGDLTDFTTLLDYLFHLPLPANVKKHPDFYNNILNRLQGGLHSTIELKVGEGPFTLQFRKMMRQLNLQVFAQNAVLTRGYKLKQALFELTEPVGHQLNTLPAINQNITELHILLGRNAQWLSQDQLDFGPSWRKMLDQAGRTTVIGPKVVEQVREESRFGFTKLQQALQAMNLDNQHPIFQRNATNTWALAPEIAALKPQLNDLFSQHFMRAIASATPLQMTPPAQSWPLWDDQALDQAQALHLDYKKYLAQTLPTFPALFQPHIRNLAQSRLVMNLSDHIALAQGSMPVSNNLVRASLDPAAQDAIQSFDLARGKLSQLAGTLRQLQAERTARQINDLLTAQANSLLSAVDKAFVQNQLYTVRDDNFLWWKGNRTLATEAFGVEEVKALGDYLGMQLAQIEALAKQSDPLVATLLNTTGERDPRFMQSANRWRKINVELDRYHTKNPNSSVAQLEKFIGTDMLEIDARNCLAKLGPVRLSSANSDYFSERKDAIRLSLAARCNDLMLADANQGYQHILTAFNQQLAGHYPFVAGRGDGSEVRPEVLADFYRTFDKYAETGRLGLSQLGKNRADVQRALRFLDQLERLKLFFATYLSTEDAGSRPSFTLNVEFRTHRAVEVGANRIADWALRSGDQTLHIHDAPRAMTWQFGDPIALDLRWAEDGDTTPLEDPQSPSLSTRDKTASIHYAGGWALLRLLRDWPASNADLRAADDPIPHAVRISIPTRTVVLGVQPAQTGQTRAFLRISLTPQGKKDTVVLPFIPDRAPALTAPIVPRDQNISALDQPLGDS